GLREAVQPLWLATNEVRLLSGSTWLRYQYDNTNKYWFAVGAPAVPVDPALPAGSAVMFFRQGPNAPGTLMQNPWYTSPPNEW
ncbi:MAG: hypothetical protein JW889_06310, partial [Verrucomicrobia bacterium]|nr:hypothetical protein [Verrucomicrobiota bacterium]